VFPDNPYGYPVLGTKQTLDGATSALLKEFNHHYYTPQNITLVVVGPIDLPAVRGMVDRIWGTIPATGYKTTPPPVPAPLKGQVRKTVERPEQQAILALGWQAPPSNDATGDAVDMVTTILGGTESARLVRRLRDEDRLVSGVTMNYAAQMGGGIVSLRLDLEAENLDKVEKIVLEEVARMQDSGPTDEERQLALIKFESQHAFDTETSEGLANAYGLAETTWTLDAELTYVDRLRKITNEQIRDAARRYLSRENFARIAFTPRKP
jgi:zinc protease